MPRVLALIFYLRIFLFNKKYFFISSLNFNNRLNFIFKRNPKNPKNNKISICPLNNIHILFKDNFIILINQVLA